MRTRTTLILALAIVALLGVIGLQYRASHSRGQSDLHRVMQQSEEKASRPTDTSGLLEDFDKLQAESKADSSDTVYTTRTGECYHRSGCSSLRKSRIPTTVSQAKADGFRPCGRCRPPE